MKTLHTYLGAMALAWCITPAVTAQSIFSLSETVQSTRSLGMGGLSATQEANAFSVYENASQVAFTRRHAQLGVQYTPWQKNQTDGTDRDNLMVSFGGHATLAPAHHLLFGFSYYAPGGNDVYPTDDQGNLLDSHRLKPAFLSASLGYAHKLGQHLGLSAVVNYAHWNLGCGPATSALSVDLGLTRRFQLSQTTRLDATFTASGWGGVFSDYSEDKMPGLLRLGGRCHHQLSSLQDLSVGLELGARCLDQSAFIASMGAEYQLARLLSLRGGYHYTSHENALHGYGTLGLGISLWHTVQADFSYLLARSESPLKKTFIVGLNLSF